MDNNNDKRDWAGLAGLALAAALVCLVLNAVAMLILIMALAGGAK